jgi:hypothetical protein
MPTKLLSPDAVRNLLVRRFNNQHQNWLSGGGVWPLDVGLGMPNEKDVADDPVDIRSWVAAWASKTGPGQIVWEERQFPRLGKHRFPAKWCLVNPEQVAVVIGQGKRWNLAVERYQHMVHRWPVFGQSTTLASKFNVLADYLSEEFEQLFSLLGWLESNPDSNLYLRQLPVKGLVTKWIEQRTGVATSLSRALLNRPEANGLYDLWGLKRPPHRARIRLLCQELRASVGGLQDVEAPIAELAMLPIAPRAVVIVENQETGLALPDMTGTVAIMKLGNAVSALGELPWLPSAAVVYWGDIDTYGFAILDRARRILPGLRSVLMDEATLLEHLSLCGQEAVQCADIELEHLHAQERAVYRGLRSNTWGPRMRLEQERLPWQWALDVLQREIEDVLGSAQANVQLVG